MKRTVVGLVVAIPVLVAAGLPSAAGAASFAPRAVPNYETRAPLKIVDGGRKVALTRAAARRNPRGTVALSCSSVPDDAGRYGRVVDVTARMRPGLRLRIPRRQDYCSAVVVTHPGRNVVGRTGLGAVALSAAGLDHLYERAIAEIMDTTVELSVGPEDEPLTPFAKLAPGIDGIRILGRRISAVQNPVADAPVPTDRIGIRIDGSRISVTATTPAGRHLVLDYDRSTRLRTSNVEPALHDLTGTAANVGD